MTSYTDYFNNLPQSVKDKLPGDLLATNPKEPVNKNNLTTNKFLLYIPRLPTVTYFCQRANLPSIFFGNAVQSTPTGLGPISRPGTRQTYEDLQIGFIVDEDMRNWLEVHDWMTSLGSNLGTKDVLKEHQKTSNIALYVLNSSYNINLTVTFHNAFPMSLSGLDFDVSVQDIDPILSTATFSYTHYTIARQQ
jgi:hypothetical protein